jgi:hypothetical protein
VLLVRDPKEMLPSLVKQLPCPTLRDRGLKEQVEILGIILEQGVDPVVLDAKKLLLEPAGVLQRACEKLGIPFEEAMLSWPLVPSPKMVSGRSTGTVACALPPLSRATSPRQNPCRRDLSHS